MMHVIKTDDILETCHMPERKTDDITGPYQGPTQVEAKQLGNLVFQNSAHQTQYDCVAD